MNKAGYFRTPEELKEYREQKKVLKKEAEEFFDKLTPEQRREIEDKWKNFKNESKYYIGKEMKSVAFTDAPTMYKKGGELIEAFREAKEEFIKTIKVPGITEELMNYMGYKITFKKIYEEAIYELDLLDDGDRV